MSRGETARYRNAKGVVKEVTFYMAMGATNEAPADFYDPDGVHWWLEGTEEPEPSSEGLPVVKDIEEIIEMLKKNG